MKTRKDTVAKAPKPDRRKKRFSDGAQKPSSKSKKTKDKEGGVKSPETSEVRKITRKKHSNVTTGPRPISYSKLATASLILKHLPPTIDYSQLKAIVPTASRLELYKKNGKRHAFARFSSTEECSTVASKLRNLKISGQEVAVAFASHSRFKQSHAATSSEADDSTTLHLSNLPFNITQEKLEEEFPTASQIVMNRNSHGRFRGSCLLQFDSPDDCCTVRDACRGRQIEGRPLRCSLAIKMDVKQTNTKSEAASAKLFGLKVKGVPTHIDESELRALFNQHKLIEFRCAKDSNEGTKTILLKFKSRHDQRAALNAFHQKAFFGVPLSAKIWSPHRRKRGQKKNKSQSPSSSNNAVEPSSLSHSKKRRWTDEDEPEDLDPTPSLDDAAAKKRKSKKKRLDLDESDASQLGTVNTPHTFPSKNLKDKHFDLSSINSTFSAGTKTTPRPKTLKKRKSLAV